MAKATLYGTYIGVKYFILVETEVDYWVLLGRSTKIKAAVFGRHPGKTITFKEKWTPITQEDVDKTGINVTANEVLKVGMHVAAPTRKSARPKDYILTVEALQDIIDKYWWMFLDPNSWTKGEASTVLVIGVK